MIDPRLLRRLLFVALFILIAGLTAFVRMLPLNGGELGRPTPDLVLCFAFAWIMRRPDYVPIGVVAILLLIGDFLFLRPPGLWPVLAVIGCEFLRSRTMTGDKVPFSSEFITVALVYGVMLLGEIAVTNNLLGQDGGYGLMLKRYLATMVTYPMVVILSVWGLRVTRPLPGSLDTEARGL